MTEREIWLPPSVRVELEAEQEFRVPLIPAKNVISGMLHPDRLPPLNAAQIASGTIDPDRLPPIDGTLIVGEVPQESIPAGIARDAEVQAAWEAHTTTADPHPQYARDTDVSAAIQQAFANLESADGSAALASHLSEANPHPQYIGGIEAAALVNGAIDSHLAATDPHPQYQTQSEVQAAIATALEGVGSSDLAEVQTAITQAVTGHTNQLDPHPQYATSAEVGAAVDQAIEGHTSATDPHPQYLTASEVQPLIDSAISSLRAELLSTIAQLSVTQSPSATVTQSSVWDNRPQALASFQTLTDGDGSTGGGAYGWIRLDYQTPQTFSSVRVGGGEWTGLLGGVAAYINGNRLQFSSDNQNWTNLVTISGVENVGDNQFKTFNFTPTTARYWRLFNEAWVFTSEFKLS